MDAATISSWMREIEASVRAERDHLVQLDAAIGDADHGINMNRGFEAVVQASAMIARAADAHRVFLQDA